LRKLLTGRKILARKNIPAIPGSFPEIPGFFPEIPGSFAALLAHDIWP
jgi:hypothetical protein